MNELVEGLKFGIGLSMPILLTAYLCSKLLKGKLEKSSVSNESLDDDDEAGDSFRFIASTIIRPPNVIRCEKCSKKMESEEND